MALRHIPCAPTVNIGERIVCQFLLNSFSDSYGVLLTNYHHLVGNGTHEHDLVLINQWGIWTLETKNWVGPIKADQISWQHQNGRREPSPITSVEIKAKALASTLRSAGFSHISVVGMVVLTGPEVSLHIIDPRKHKVFRTDMNLIRAVSGPKYRFRPSSVNLTEEQTRQVADMFVHRTVDPERKIIGNYRLLRGLGAQEGFQVYEAVHITFAHRRARVKRYHMTNISSAAELREAERRFQRDMLALTKVEDHPHIVRAYEFLLNPDGDDSYWLILEWIKGITLQDLLDYELAIPFDEQLRILRALAVALDYCHKAGILHRNLTPSSVYLSEDGAVKLGDFDFARVEGVDGTISELGAPLTVNKYTAPELRINARAADARSDLYALGAIWYDMALCSRDKNPVLISRLREAALPDDARELLKCLLEPQPGDRPASAQEVEGRLRRL